MIKQPRVFSPTIGTDPEVFVYSDMSSRIEVVLDTIGGDKAYPRKILGRPGFAVQEDNVLAEFNVPPAHSREQFIVNVHEGLEIVGKLLGEHNLKPLIKTSHTFQPEQFNDDRCFQLGCEPDYDAWTLTINAKPDVEANKYMRCAGGHVMIGYAKPNEETNLELIREMDVYLGIPSLILDKDTERRKLYGKAGAFRSKDFGVEYRTLSSFWLGSRELTGWVYDQVMEVINRVNSGTTLSGTLGKSIAEIINTGNVDAAREFVSGNNIKLPANGY